jgi:hypothetical protein
MPTKGRRERNPGNSNSYTKQSYDFSTTHGIKTCWRHIIANKLKLLLFFVFVFVVVKSLVLTLYQKIKMKTEVKISDHDKDEE